MPSTRGRRPTGAWCCGSSRPKATVRFVVNDNGIGIPPENLSRIFSHGFTTRKEGHGFGMHSSALAAQELGGTLKAQSDGPGKGATFTLEIPLAPKEPGPAAPVPGRQ